MCVCGFSERKEGSESTGVVRGGSLAEEGFEGRVGLVRPKHKCSVGKSVMLHGRLGETCQRRLWKPS